MVLFSPEGKLKKYNSIEEILETFYNLRLEYYHLRKDYMISLLKKEVATLSNKARFIKMVIEDELVIKRKKRAVLVNELYALKFDTQTMLNEKKQKTKEELHNELELQNNNANNGEENSININEGNNSDSEQKNKIKDEIKPKVPIKEYDYLLNMNLWSLTHEKIEELLKQKELKEKELEILKKTEVETLWDNDLDDLEEELTKYEKGEEEDRLLAQKLNKGKSGVSNPKRRRGGRKKKSSGEKSEDNNSNDDYDNSDSNNTSLISDSTNIITKKNKNKKTTKIKKAKNQTSLNNFIEGKNKKKEKNKNNDKDSELDFDDVSKNSKSGISSDNNKDSSSSESDDNNDENSDNNFKIPLKESLIYNL